MINPPTASTSPAFPYTTGQWTTRRQFVDQVNSICRLENIKVEWLSHFWIARLERSSVHRYLTGYAFPVNPADAVAVARDKVATFEVLASAGVPVVPHWALHFPPLPVTPASLEHLADYAIELHPLPLVVKPVAGSTGRDVHRAESRTELLGHLDQLSSHYHTAAISPLVSKAEEFRVITLDSKPEIIFRKVRPRPHSKNAEWRHNLALGSTPAPVTDSTQIGSLSHLAVQTMAVLGLTLGAVDIISSSAGLQVIEVNTGFTMHHLSLDRRFTHQADRLLTTVLKLSVA